MKIKFIIVVLLSLVTGSVFRANEITPKCVPLEEGTKSAVSYNYNTIYPGQLIYVDVTTTSRFDYHELHFELNSVQAVYVYEYSVIDMSTGETILTLPYTTGATKIEYEYNFKRSTKYRVVVKNSHSLYEAEINYLSAYLTTNKYQCF